MPNVVAFGGALTDGTPYLVRKPANWNGIVVRDLDGVSKRASATYRMLLRAGYGTAGTSRRPGDRAWTLNRLDDVRRQEGAVQAFAAKFGKPRLVIAFGNSAGGASAIVSAERFPDTVDGAVAMCPTMDFLGYAGFNQIFDFFYVMKTLLGPNDDRLVTHALPARNYQPLLDHWSTVLRDAATTPAGRARIALGFALSHYPVYAKVGKAGGLASPDFDDPDAAVDAMIQSLPQIVRRLERLRVYGENDFPPGLAIAGSPQADIAGNDGAAYADYWKDANPSRKRVAEALYAKANLSVGSDVEAVDAAPRVEMDRRQLNDDWLLGRGLPAVPVFRVENLGDIAAVPAISTLYDDLIAMNGLGALYRTAQVDNSGHCDFRPEQQFTAIEVMRERLQTGRWPATDPAVLNVRSGGDADDNRYSSSGNRAAIPAPGAMLPTQTSFSR